MKTMMFTLVCAIGLASCEKSDEATNPQPVSSSQVVSNPTTSPSYPMAMNSTTYPPMNPATNPYDMGMNSTTMPTTAPNNTGINTRDRNADAVTPGMQGENKSDIDMTAEIRRRIMDQKMSVTAENIKIITQNGKVTLRGPVPNQTEKDSINQIATAVAGSANVDNQLDVQ